MKKLINSVVALAVLVILNSPAYAVLIDLDSYITDTNSGLDWLDVSASTNRTYDEVILQQGKGGDFEGWRFATSDEFLGFTDNREGYEVSKLLGYIESNPFSLFEQSYDDFFTAGMLLNYNEEHNIGYSSFFWNEPQFPDEPRFASFPIVVKSYTFEDGCDYNVFCDINEVEYPEDLIAARRSFQSELGSFMVRDSNMPAVPLPTAAFMFVPALLGLLGFRRKIRA